MPLLVVVALLIVAVTSRGVVHSQTSNGRFDEDGDGLIEVEYLEQLNAIRYDLNGDGTADTGSGVDGEALYDSAFPTSASESVCERDCSGYELNRSLNFSDSASYASGTVNSKWTMSSGWLPIGFGDNSFDATFDGNGHTIHELYISRTTTLEDPGAIGLFGIISSSGVIRQLKLADVDITGGQVVGGLVGWNQGAVKTSYVGGSVAGGGSLGQDGEGGIGGITGINSGTVESSDSTGAVSGTSGVGGLVGSNGHFRSDQGKTATISDSYSLSDVSASESSVGGLAGGNFGEIRYSNARGNVTGESYLVGGLVGWNVGEIESSFASGAVSGSSEVGGLSGRNEEYISASYSTSNVSGDERVGGLVGENMGTVISSYASGSVNGRGSAIGGLVGWNRAVVKASYASGNVSGEGGSPREDWISGVGGLIGSNSSPNQTSLVRGCFANGDVTGVENVGGLVGHNGASGTVIADYATGSAMGTNNVGGLVGRNVGAISASFATGSVSGEEATGGVVGSNLGSIYASYWDMQTSGLNVGVGEGDHLGTTGADTAVLQSPTTYAGIYGAWNTDLDNADGDFDPATGVDDFWDFGTPGDYPAIKVDIDGDGVSTWHELNTQGRPLPAPTLVPESTATLTPTPAPTATPRVELTSAVTLTPTPTVASTNSPTLAATDSPTPPSVRIPDPTPAMASTVVPTGTSTLVPSEVATPIVQSVMVVVTATPAPSPLTSPILPGESDGGTCGLSVASEPVGTAVANLFLLVAPVGMVWGLKWRRRRRRRVNRK